MKILHLHVKAEYWDAVKRGEKTEEYRSIKPYWENILSKKYHLIYYYKGYPKKKDKNSLIIFKYNGYHKRRINHKILGPTPVMAFVIPLGFNYKQSLAI